MTKKKKGPRAAGLVDLHVKLTPIDMARLKDVAEKLSEITGDLPTNSQAIRILVRREHERLFPKKS